MGPRKSDWIGIDPLFSQPFELLAAYTDLFRQAFGGQRIGEGVWLSGNVGGDLSRVLLAGPFQRPRGWFLAMPAQGRQRWSCQKTLCAARRGADPRQIRGVLEADVSGLTFGLVLGIRAVERLQLPVPARQH